MAMISVISGFAIIWLGVSPTMAAFTVKHFDNGVADVYFSDVDEFFAKFPLIEAIQVITGVIIVRAMKKKRRAISAEAGETSKMTEAQKMSELSVIQLVMEEDWW
jgi:hypothetical protein